MGAFSVKCACPITTLLRRVDYVRVARDSRVGLFSRALVGLPKVEVRKATSGVFRGLLLDCSKALQHFHGSFSLP